MPRDNICVYMAHVYFMSVVVMCGVCRNICCVAGVVENSAVSLGVLKYVVCL